jgi:hypothetical protein
MVGLLASVRVDDRLPYRSSYLNRRPPLIILNNLEFAGTAQGVRFWKEILGGEKGLSGHRTDCYVELGKRIIWQPQPIHRHIRM